MEIKNKKYIIIILSVAILIFLYLILEFNGIFTSDESKKMNVQSGEGFYKVSSELKKNDIIGSNFLFKMYAKIFCNKKINSIKPGELSFSGRTTYKNIMDELVKLRAKSVTVTIPEGYELREIAELLSCKKLIDKDKFYDVCKNYDFEYPYIKEIEKRDNRLEGFLFPDTYKFYVGEDDEISIIKTMLAKFDDVIEKYKKDMKKNNLTIYETVTLASVIEREAMFNDDFYNVSSVFHNRLKRDDNLSKLQSCATVQYILKERKSVLSTADTKIKSPYNTYINSGLPKGPIASPGKTAIEAALNPNDTDYLYFLNDSEGHLHFSKDFNEHQKLMKKYIGK